MSKEKNQLVITPPQTLAPVQDASGSLTVQAFADKINRSYRKSIENVFETALYCCEAEDAWPGQRKKLIALLEMGESNFSRYCIIGRDTRLLPLKDKLPAHFSTIYECTKLKDAALAQAVKSEKVHVRMKRRHAVDLVKEQQPSKARELKSDPDPKPEHSDPERKPEGVLAFISPSETASIADGGRAVPFKIDGSYQDHQAEDFENWVSEGRRMFTLEVLNLTETGREDDVPAKRDQE